MEQPASSIATGDDDGNWHLGTEYVVVEASDRLQEAERTEAISWSYRPPTPNTRPDPGEAHPPNCHEQKSDDTRNHDPPVPSIQHQWNHSSAERAHDPAQQTCNQFVTSRHSRLLVKTSGSCGSLTEGLSPIGCLMPDAQTTLAHGVNECRDGKSVAVANTERTEPIAKMASDQFDACPQLLSSYAFLSMKPLCSS